MISTFVLKLRFGRRVWPLTVGYVNTPLLPLVSFRGLFYKGDGGEMGRTPSAWLCPHSNHIALRVTSDTDPDIGVDSIASLTAGSWSHVAFTFDNSTKHIFSATIFINGTLDISMEFSRTNVLGNDGPLHVGRDPSNRGPRRVQEWTNFRVLCTCCKNGGGCLSPGSILWTKVLATGKVE